MARRRSALIGKEKGDPLARSPKMPFVPKGKQTRSGGLFVTTHFQQVGVADGFNLFFFG